MHVSQVNIFLPFLVLDGVNTISQMIRPMFFLIWIRDRLECGASKIAVTISCRPGEMRRRSYVRSHSRNTKMWIGNRKRRCCELYASTYTFVRFPDVLPFSVQVLPELYFFSWKEKYLFHLAFPPKCDKRRNWILLQRGPEYPEWNTRGRWRLLRNPPEMSYNALRSMYCTYSKEIGFKIILKLARNKRCQFNLLKNEKSMQERQHAQFHFSFTDFSGKPEWYSRS